MADDPARIPIGNALPGIEIVPLPDGVVPIEAIVLVKVVDVEGDPTWVIRYPRNTTNAEDLGALEAAAAISRNGAIQAFADVEDGPG